MSLADVCVLIKIFDMEEGMEENSREQNLNATRSDKFGRFSFVLLKVQHDRGWRLSASILVFEAWEESAYCIVILCTRFERPSQVDPLVAPAGMPLVRSTYLCLPTRTENYEYHIQTPPN